MKKMVFAVALGASVAVFGAWESENEIAIGVDNPISFEGYTAQTSVQIENGVEYDETGVQKEAPYFYFDGSEDGSTVKTFGGCNAAAPQTTRPVYFASATSNNNYLELDTADGILWRSLLEANSTGPGSALGIAEDGTYFDSLMQFQPVPYGVTNEVSAAEKLAIWLQVDKIGETTVTNLLVRAAYIDNDGSETSTIATNYVLATSAPIIPDQWYRLTVKALADVTQCKERSADSKGFTGFEIYLDGVQLAAATPTFGAGYMAYATDEEDGWLDATWEADLVTYLQSGKVFPSLLGPSDDDTIQAVGFRGAGAVDDLVWTDDDPFVTVAIEDVSYHTLSEALAEAQDYDTITLLQDITLTQGLVFDSNTPLFLTLDLGGHTLSYPTASSSDYLITVDPENWLFIMNGTLTTTGRGAFVHGGLYLLADTSLTADCRALNIIGVDGNTTTPAVCIIAAGATVTHGNGDDVAILVRGSEGTQTSYNALAILDVYGTIVDTATTPGQYGITGNGGNATLAEINFYDGSVYTFADISRPMMWLPQNDLNLYGGTLTSAGGGIIVLCGKVNVPADSTVTVTATGPAGAYQNYNNCHTGDALYFAATGTRYPRSQYKDTLPEGVGVDQVEANIAGGTFTSENGEAIAAYTDSSCNGAVALTNFVRGGLYSSEPAATLLAPKYLTKTVSDPAGYYMVYRKLLGSGTAQDPFQIADRDDLEFFRDQVNNANALGTPGQHFVQLADIDLGGDLWIDIGNVNDPAACFLSSPVFSGVYDGGGHVVSNFVLSGYSYCGFFGTITNGTVKNLQILDARSPDAYVAGTQTTKLTSGAIFCGDMENNCLFENITVSGYIWGNHNVGGFSSWCEGNITMLSCTNLANVGTSFTKLGGFHSYYGNTMTLFCSNCCNKGTLTFDKVQRGNSTDATAAVGGFVGYQQNPGKMIFVDCVNEGALNATYTSGSVGIATVGGFVGRANTSGISLAITNGVSTGALTANVTNANEQAEVGGFIGRMVKGVSLSMDNVTVAAGTALSATVKDGVTSNVCSFVGRDINSPQTAILTYGIAPSEYAPGITNNIAGGYNSTSMADGLTTYFIKADFDDDGAEGLLTTNTTVTAVDVAIYVAGVTGEAAPVLVTKPMVLSYLLNANKILTTPETDVLKITEIKQVTGGWAITVAATLNADDVAAGATVDMSAITGDLKVVATADLGTDFAPVAAENFEVGDGAVNGTAVITVTDANARFLKATVTK